MPALCAHEGDMSAALYRSSLFGYWKSDAPNAGVNGEAYMLKEAPEESVKVYVPSVRKLMPLALASDEAACEIIVCAFSTSAIEPPSPR